MKNLLLLLILTLCFSCKNEKNCCVQFVDEKYSNIKIEPKFLNEQYKYIDYLYSKFGTQQIDTNLNEGYQIIFYSSHGFGKLINFERKINTFNLSMKSIQKEGWTKYKDNYSIQIDLEDWNKLVDIIYKYDFWTEETQRTKIEGVLDGFAIFISGYRSDAKKCNKRFKHFILRSSPEYDKIGSLVESIIDFEERLEFKYHQQSK